MPDIGEILFREILGMSSYPGSPFTGNIFQDLILFFFVPTVFLIIFVYVASAIVIAPENSKLRLLMGIAIYAFIIASRYFEGFAIFASQFYFIFVIFLGIIYFLGRHFRRPGGGRMAYEGGGHGGGRMGYEGGGHGGNATSQISDSELEHRILTLATEYEDLKRRNLDRSAQEVLTRLIPLRDELYSRNVPLSHRVNDVFKRIKIS